MRAWLARDRVQLFDRDWGLLFYKRRPVDDGSYWMSQYGGGRWPMPNVMKLKPGQCVEVEIKRKAKL